MTISTTTLRCGLPLIVERIEGVRSVGICWLVPGGDAHDPKNAQGRAAMWSELLMRGSGALDSRAQADAFDRTGASRSVENGRNFLRIGATALGNRLADVAPLLADMVLDPRFDDAAVEASRELCVQALASLDDDPQERAMLAARERHHPEPLNRSGYGTEEDLLRITPDELRAGWRAAASPRGSILALAGDVDPDAAASLFDGLLARWSGPSAELALGAAPPRGYAHATEDSNQVQVIVVHDAPREDQPDAALERVLNSALSGGMSGRLFSEVREKRGLCYSVSAGYAAGKEFGAVTAYVGTTPERAQQSLDVLWAELLRVADAGNGGPVTPEEFARAVAGMKSRLVFSGESTNARARALAFDQHRIGRPRSLDELAAEVDAVTLARLHDYQRRRQMGRVTVQTLGPAALTPPAGV